MTGRGGSVIIEVCLTLQSRLSVDSVGNHMTADSEICEFESVDEQ